MTANHTTKKDRLPAGLGPGRSYHGPLLPAGGPWSERLLEAARERTAAAAPRGSGVSGPSAEKGASEPSAMAPGEAKPSAIATGKVPTEPRSRAARWRPVLLLLRGEARGASEAKGVAANSRQGPAA